MSSPPPRADIPKLTDLPLRVETAKLVLRPLEERDAETIFPIASIPDFPRWMSWNAHTSIEETRTWLAGVVANRQKGSDLVWAIERDGHFVGQIGLLGITWQSMAWRRDSAEIGYWVAPAVQNQGIATEALLAATKFGFETLELHKLKIGCIVDNLASKKVIDRCAFRCIGRLEEDVWRDGRWWAHWRYEMTITEYSDISSTLRFSRPRPA